jgi:hypothetical protein
LVSGFPIPRGEGETGQNKRWDEEAFEQLRKVVQHLLGFRPSDFRSSPFGLRCGFGYILYHFEKNVKHRIDSGNSLYLFSVVRINWKNR